MENDITFQANEHIVRIYTRKQTAAPVRYWTESVIALFDNVGAVSRRVLLTFRPPEVGVAAPSTSRNPATGDIEDGHIGMSSEYFHSVVDVLRSGGTIEVYLDARDAANNAIKLL